MSKTPQASPKSPQPETPQADPLASLDKNVPKDPAKTRAYWKQALTTAKAKIDTSKPQARVDGLAALAPMRDRYRAAVERDQARLPAPKAVRGSPLKR